MSSKSLREMILVKIDSLVEISSKLRLSKNFQLLRRRNHKKRMKMMKRKKLRNRKRRKRKKKKRRKMVRRAKKMLLQLPRKRNSTSLIFHVKLLIIKMVVTAAVTLAKMKVR